MENKEDSYKALKNAIERTENRKMNTTLFNRNYNFIPALSVVGSVVVSVAAVIIIAIIISVIIITPPGTV